MPIIVYGVSHKTAALSVRECLVHSWEDIPDALLKLKLAVPCIKEAMILSTCQRTEWYFYTDEQALDFSNVITPQISALLKKEKAAHYFLSDRAAVRHMMQVANGLDSSLLGEPQILGQMKKAYAVAKNAHFLGRHLEQVMQFIFATTKQVRHQTAIGYGSLSLSSTAMSLGKCVFSQIPNPKVLLIGAGSVVQNILGHLDKKEKITTFIANRSFDKADALAKKYNAQAVRLEDVYQYVALADIIISATKSPSLVLSYLAVKGALALRESKPLFVMDMAVPRDVAPEISSLPLVVLNNIDDLHKVVQKSLDAKKASAEDAKQMIEAQLDVLMERMCLSQVAPMIHALRSNFNLFRHNVLEYALLKLQQDFCVKTLIDETLSKLEEWAKNACPVACNQDFREVLTAQAFRLLSQGKSPDQVLSKVTYSFVNKRLHQPILELRRMSVRAKNAFGTGHSHFG